MSETYNDLMRLAKIAVKRFGGFGSKEKKLVWQYDELTVAFEQLDLSRQSPIIKKFSPPERLTVWYRGMVVHRLDDCTEPLASIREVVTILDELADV